MEAKDWPEYNPDTFSVLVCHKYTHKCVTLFIILLLKIQRLFLVSFIKISLVVLEIHLKEVKSRKNILDIFLRSNEPPQKSINMTHKLDRKSPQTLGNAQIDFV
jgi:hypothetical protein